LKSEVYTTKAKILIITI